MPKLISFSILFAFLLNTSFMKEQKIYTLLCLGDSYTIGEMVEEKERFPMQTVALLKQQNILFQQPVIIAKTGWTTDELLTAITDKNLHQKFDYVTLLIGVNNQYRNRDLENYRKEFNALLATATAYANGNKKHVIVISIPNWGVTPFGQKDTRGEFKIGEEIDAYNAVNKQETAKQNCIYINITSESKKAKKDGELIANDGLHPSGKMYANWANKLANALQKQIIQ